jgi:predicted branched-subunit amino acid permease
MDDDDRTITDPVPTLTDASATLAPVVPIAVAIGAFGVIYGAAATPVLGAPLTLVSSAVVFSGAGQFALVGLLGAGATMAAVLAAVAVLNLRHLALGAVVRPLIEGQPAWRRAVLAWFLVDETVGLTLAARARPARTLLLAGATCYLAFLAGTAIGLTGADLPRIEPLAAAVFPVLFVGLASLMVAGWRDLLRVVAAAAAVALVALALPGALGLAPIVSALVVASVGARR